MPEHPIDTSADDFFQRLCARLPANGGNVLDVGCGRGAHLAGSRAAPELEDFRARGGTIVGIDMSPPPDGNPFVDRLALIGKDGRWPVADSSVDLAYCDWVLEHVSESDSFFAEVSRVLRPNAAFVARTMQTWSVAGIGARVVPHRFHQMMIRKLQPGMREHDIFRTALQCNTRRSLSRFMSNAGLRLGEVETHATLAGYAFGRPTLEHRVASMERRLPQGMHHALVVTGYKLSNPIPG